MHVLDLLAWVGAAISWWGTARYMISIGKRETHPRLASWIAWGTANGVFGAMALMNGYPMAAIFNCLAALGNIAVLLLSAMKRVGTKPQGTTDWACLAVAGLCLGTILLFPEKVMMDAVLAMFANVIATWPTIRHAWQKPKEEAWQLFAANAGAGGLGLVSVFASSGSGLGSIAGPLISMIGNLSLVLITVGRGWLTKTVEEVEEAAEEMALEAAQELEILRETLTPQLAPQFDAVNEQPMPTPVPINDIRAPVSRVPAAPMRRPLQRQKPRLIRSY